MSIETFKFSRRSRRAFFVNRKRISLLVAATMATSGLTMVAVAAPVAAAPVSIKVEKSAPEAILVGEPISYSLKATNPADDGDADAQYNVSFRDVLPAGVAYVSTSAPAGIGDPQQIAELNAQNQPTGRTILIWKNIADLPDGSVTTLQYKVQPDAAIFPVGETVTNDATGYASSNERRLPKFDAKGNFLADPVISQSSDSASTLISALELKKSEPSSENELVRGVHDRTTVYTLDVINNGKSATNGVTVVDYLPAGLEFLGCGQVDNSSPVPEYPGSGRLDGTPAVPTNCLTPTSVTTVNSGLPTGYPPGVYTRVEWTLPSNLAANATYKIKYAAGIPLRENAMISTPGFKSTANLDNNTGASTRETGSEKSYTNRATATGRYQGLNKAGATNFEVSAKDTNTVTSEDIAVAKSITNGSDFAQGDIVNYQLRVRTSEYTDGSDIVLVDTLADGLCPADAPASTYTPTALTQAGSGECKPATTGNAAIDKVDYIGGNYVITFKAIDVTADDAAKTIAYKATLRSFYNGSSDETSAGDSYTNTVDLKGKTTPIPGTSESGVQNVNDDSSASFGSDSPQLDKRILPNTAAVHTCAENNWDNWKDSQKATADAGFNSGSRVCFQVRVTFPNDSSTRNPIVTDFLPDNLSYEAGSFKLVSGVNTAPFTIDQTAITADFADGSASLRPGTGTPPNRYVEKNQVFAFTLSAIVQPTESQVVDVQGNLAKLRWTNRAGQVSSLRDQSEFKILPVPPVGIVKKVAKVGPPLSTFADEQTIRQGDTVRFKVDVTNSSAAPTGVPIRNVQVWDVLPPGFRCADVVTPIDSAGVCTNPGASGHPTFDGNNLYSAIVWTKAGPIAPGASDTMTYDATVPVGTSVGTTYVNTAAVRTYNELSNINTSIPHFPQSNIDNTVTSGQMDVPAAKDTAAVKLPPVGLLKSNVTGVTGDNNAVLQAVPGESVTYTIRATIPKKTTVYNGVLSDVLPTGITFVSASAKYSADATLAATDPLPNGVDLTTTNGTLTLPTTWQNSTDKDQLFEVTIVAKVTPNYTGTSARTNTAKFNSKTVENGLIPVTEVLATSSITPIHPAPALTKALTTPPVQSTTPAIGESREFVLTASNGTGKPTLFDTQVIDCVPAGLTVTVLGTGATQAPSTTGGPCASATGTTITWNVGAIVGGTSQTLKYTVKVGLGAAGGQSYNNVAKLTGSSLDNGSNDPAVERVQTSTDNKTLTVPSALITKTIADNTLIVGELADYTITATLPPHVNFYDLRVTDVLPGGLDPTTLVTTSVGCETADPDDCTVSNTALTRDGQKVGWFLGDVTESEFERTVKIKFTAKVAVPCDPLNLPACNAAGNVRSNSAVIGWNIVNGTDPTSVTSVPGKNSTSPAVDFTVLEPTTAINKVVDNATPAPGDTLTYTVTASNPGGTNVSDAHSVIVKDVVPVGVVVDVDSVEESGGTYDADTRTITWTIEKLTTASPGNSKSFTYTATLAASGTLTGAALTNTATVTQYKSLVTGGRTYTGPSDPAIVTPKFPAATVAKTVGSAVSYVGAPQSFTITVTSNGNSPAYKIDVQDVLPKSWTFDAGSATVKIGSAAAIPLPPTANVANPQTITWSDLAPAGLPVGSTIVINYTATPATGALTDAGAGATVPHTNTVAINVEDKTGATKSGVGEDGTVYAGPDTSASTYLHKADVKVVKSAVGTPVAGKTFSWDIVVSNLGPDAAVGPIVVKDTVPTGVTNFSLSGTGWTCSAALSVWTCTHPGPIAATSPATALAKITASGLIGSDIESGTELENTATVSAKTYDPETSNNTSTPSVDITTLADLSIDKNVSGAVNAGGIATWTLGVTNLGPSTSRGPIKVKDTLPAGSEFVEASGSGWTCEEGEGDDAGTVTCIRAADLLLSAVAPQITVKAKIPASQTANVVNSARVTATTTEPDTDTARDNNTDSTSTPPVRATVLTLEKALHGTEPAVPGANVTYDMTVSNAGLSTATGVVLVDELPDYMTFVSGGGGTSDWTCEADEQVVTCELDGSIGVGTGNSTSTFQITAKIDSDHTGQIVNSALVTATEDPTGDDDDDSNTPTLKSDLEVEKSHEGDAIAGESLTYDLVVTNHGPSDTAGPIVVKDTIPAGMTYKSFDGTGWACVKGVAGEGGAPGDLGKVVCTHAGGMIDDATSSFSLTFDVGINAGPATVTNIATVSGPNTDPVPLNNSDTDPTTIVDEANISITKVGAVETADSGTNVSWTLQVTNDGPSTADAIRVAETLPVGLTIVSISGTDWTCSTTTLVCTLDDPLVPGDAEPITVVTKIGSGVAADVELTNTASVSTSTPGDDEDDNEAEDSVTTTTSADLRVNKTHEGVPVAGKSFDFTISGKNIGPSDALAPIQISDTLPVGMTYRSANAAWSCVPGPVSDEGQEVLCTLVNTDPIVPFVEDPPSVGIPDLVMKVDVEADKSGVEMTNIAAIESATPDPMPEDNVDSDPVTPTDEVDLSITKAHTDAVEIGEELTFQVNVHNEGPSEARDVKVEDLLPTGLTYVRAEGEGWTCDEDESVCTLDEPLAPDSDADPITVTVMVTPEAYPGVDNVAVVSTTSNDTDPTNDEATDPVVVPAKVNLSIVKELEGKLRVGQPGTYTLTVHNDGPTPDPGPIAVTDELPTGLTFVSGTAEGWTCAAEAQLVTCDREGDFAVDETEVITLKVDVDAKAYPSVINTAIVTTPSDDTDPEDNSSTITTPVDGSAVLTIDKSLDHQDGDQAVWSIQVTNEGPTETTKRIRVTDKLPKGLKFVSAEGDGWTCSNGQTVTCDFDGALAVGETVEILITTKITIEDGSEIVNVATVEGGNKVAESGVLSDDATAVAPEADGQIPDTGGPMLWLLLAGLIGVFGGSALVIRRRPKVGRHL